MRSITSLGFDQFDSENGSQFSKILADKESHSANCTKEEYSFRFFVQCLLQSTS